MSYNSVYDGDPAGYDRLRSGWLNRRRADFIAGRLADTLSRPVRWPSKSARAPGGF